MTVSWSGSECSAPTLNDHRPSSTREGPLERAHSSSSVDTLAPIYRSAIYSVLVGPVWCPFRVDELPPFALAQWLEAKGGSCWLTAFNPGSRALSSLENLVRHQALWTLLKQHEPAAKLGSILVGYGADPAGLWPDETSLLVANLAPEQAAHYALQFGQAAFLYLQAQKPVQLLWTCDFFAAGTQEGE